jgi:hypothetical protein
MGRGRCGEAVPATMLLAAVLAAQGRVVRPRRQRGLRLRGEQVRVPDIDAVPAPGGENLERLHAVLADLAVTGKVPAARSLATAHLVTVRTGYGTLDCLLDRGRQDWCRLRAGAGPFTVAGERVLAASADDIRWLRTRFKERGDDGTQRLRAGGADRPGEPGSPVGQAS